MDEERKNYTIELFLNNGHGCGANIQKYVGCETFEEMLRDAHELLLAHKGLVYNACVSTDCGKLVITNITALILYMMDNDIV